MADNVYLSMNKPNKNRSASLNLIPLISDFTLLTFGVLILVFVGALFTLARSEMPTSFESDLYFPSGHWELTLEDEVKLYRFIEDSIFTQIKQEFRFYAKNVISTIISGLLYIIISTPINNCHLGYPITMKRFIPLERTLVPE